MAGMKKPSKGLYGAALSRLPRPLQSLANFINPPDELPMPGTALTTAGPRAIPLDKPITYAKETISQTFPDFIEEAQKAMRGEAISPSSAAILYNSMHYPGMAQDINTRLKFPIKAVQQAIRKQTEATEPKFIHRAVKELSNLMLGLKPHQIAPPGSGIQ